jgi:signal transduction histidine kinase
VAKSVDMAARKRLREETEARVEQQGAMAELSRLAAEGQGAQALMEAAVPIIARALHVDCVELLEQVPDGLVLRAGLGWQPGPIGTMNAVEHDDSAAGQVLRSRETVLTLDLSHGHRSTPSRRLAEAGLTSGLAVRVPGSQRPFGVLAVYSKKQRTFHRADAEFVRTAAALLSTALSWCRAQSYAKVLLQLGADICDALDPAELVDRAQRRTSIALPCNAVALLRWDQRQQSFRFTSGSGIPAEAMAPIEELFFERDSWLGRRLAHSGAFAANDMQLQKWLSAEFRARFPVSAFIAAPLRVPGTDLGTLVAFSTVPGDAFGPEQVEFCTAIAGHLALALDHMRMIEELEYARQAKADFVATMSHELRTPLHVIMGYNDLLLEGVLGRLSLEQVESLQHVSERARELLNLIRAMLTLTQIEGSGLPQEMDVKALVRELEAEFGEAGKNAAPRPVWNVAPGIPKVRTERAKLKVIIEHLVDNAVKFTDPDGCVRVDFRPSEGGIEVTVSDSGIGIDSERLPTLFEPFRAVQGLSTMESDGVGLYTVRRLLDMLGGTITVETTPGRGSVFRVWVPPDMTRQTGTVGHCGCRTGN